MADLKNTSATNKTAPYTSLKDRLLAFRRTTENATVQALETRHVFDAAMATQIEQAMDHTSAIDSAAHEPVLSDAAAAKSLVTAIGASADKALADSQIDKSFAATHGLTNADATQRSGLFGALVDMAGDVSAAEAPRHEIYFIDGSLEDKATLIAAIPAGSEIIEIDASKDGVAQMVKALAGREGIDAIHILSHGHDGELHLGTAVIDAESMSGVYKSAFASIGANLSANADILIYGCDFAAGAKGSEAVNLLASLTGADIAASTDITGASNLGGDWTLEKTTGAIDEKSLAALDYDHVLASISYSWEASAWHPTLSTLPKIGDIIPSSGGGIDYGTVTGVSAYTSHQGRTTWQVDTTYSAGNIFYTPAYTHANTFIGDYHDTPNATHFTISGTAGSVMGPEWFGYWTDYPATILEGPYKGTFDLAGHTYVADASGSPDVVVLQYNQPGNNNIYVMHFNGGVILEASHDSTLTAMGQAKTIDVRTNDVTTANGSTSTYAVESNPAHGTVTMDSNGVFTYTPTAGYAGADSFTYSMTNAFGGDDIATVNVNVTGTIDAIDRVTTTGTPIALNITPENGVRSVQISGLPTDAVLSAGTKTGNVWTVEANQLSGLTVTSNITGNYTYEVSQIINANSFTAADGGTFGAISTGGKSTLTVDNTQYVNVSGALAANTYDLVTVENQHPIWIDLKEKNAPGDGYYMIANPENTTNAIYKQSLTLEPNTQYRFQIDIANLIYFESAHPNISFFMGGVEIGNTGNVPFSDINNIQDAWKTYNIDFVTDATGGSKLFELRNNQPDGNGNDFGIDNIIVSKVVKDTATLQINTPLDAINRTTTTGVPVMLNIVPDNNAQVIQISGLPTDAVLSAGVKRDGVWYVDPVDTNGLTVISNTIGAYNYEVSQIVNANSFTAAKNGTFGADSAGGAATLAAGTTTYTYRATAGGTYAYDVVKQQTAYTPDWLPIQEKDNPGDGYFMLVNPGYTKDTFFTETVSLEPNTTYRFQIDIANLSPYAANSIYALPNVSFSVGGVQIGTTGDIAQSSSPNAQDAWQTYSVDFTTDATGGSKILELKNNKDTSLGNDFAIDNIFVSKVVKDPAVLNVTAFNPIGAEQTSLTTPEDTTLVFSTANANKLQVLAPNQTDIRTVTLIPHYGLISLSGTTGLTFIEGDGISDNTVKFTGTVANINAALEGATFAPNPEYSGPADVQMIVKTPPTASGALVNGNFESMADASATANKWYPTQTIQGWQTTAPDGTFEVIGSGFNSDGLGAVTAYDGVNFIELNANYVSATSQIIQSNVGDELSFSFAHRGRLGDDTINVKVIDLGADGVENAGDTVIFTKNYTDNNTTWGYYNEIIGSASGNKLKLVFESISAAGGNQGSGNFIDAISLKSERIDSATININVTPVDDAPTLASATTTTYTEAHYVAGFVEGNNGVSIVSASPAIADIDNTTMSSAHIVLTNAQAGDYLDLNNLPAGITSTGGGLVNGQIIVDLSGTASLSDYQTALQSIKFASTSLAMDTTVRVVSVSVSDGTLSTNIETTNINITPTNDAPQLTNPNLSSAAVLPEGTTITPINMAAEFFDPDGNTLTYSATGLPAGLSIDPTTGVISGTIGATAEGNYNMVVTATDTAGLTNTKTLELAVLDGSADNPVLNSAALPANISGLAGLAITPVNVSSAFSDPQGDALTYSATGLPSGLSINPTTGVISGTPDVSIAGSFTTTITATDPSGNLVTATVPVTIADASGNSPVVNSAAMPASIAGTEGVAITPVNVASAFSDPQGDTLTYTATGLPAGLTIDPATGVISGTPSATGEGTYAVTITATDTGGHLVTANVPVVIGDGTADDPVVNSGALPASISGTAGLAITPVSIASAFTDPQGDVLAYSASGLPAGLSIDPTTGVISGTPDVSLSGSFTATITAIDASGNLVSAALPITIGDASGNNPVVNSAALPASIAGVEGVAITPVNVGSAFTDPQGDALIFTASGLPAGLTIDPFSGIISGTPSATGEGTYPITITATDATGHITTATVPMIIGDGTADNPVLNSAALPANISGLAGLAITPVNVSSAFSDPQGDALTYSATGLPSGLSINPTTGVISGTPDVSIAGSFTTTITATDPSGNLVTASIPVTINDASGNNPIVNAAALPNPITGTEAVAIAPVDVSSAFTDPQGEALTYAASGLPAGLSISPTGIISGTPTATGEGTYPIIITVTDATGHSTTSAMELIIGDGAADNPTVNPALLPNPVSGTLNQSMQPIDLSTAFADPQGEPLTYAATGLPSGVVLDAVTGMLTGIPTGAAGNYTATITATDAAGNTTSTAVTFTIGDATTLPPVIDTSKMPSAMSAKQGVWMTPVDVSPAFTDPEGQTITFTARGLPAGLAMDASSGVMFGTPAAGTAGTYMVTVTALDANGGTLTYDIPLTVTDPMMEKPVVNAGNFPASVNGIATLPLTPTDMGQYFTDPQGDTLSFSATGMPAGLVINPATGVISGTPNDVGGSYTITLTATDSHGNATTSQFVMNIAPAPDPVIIDPIIPPEPFPILKDDNFVGTNTASITLNVLANDVNASSVQKAEALNGTVTINADGSLNYTPKAGFVGKDVVTYSVFHSTGQFVTATATVTVSNPDPVTPPAPTNIAPVAVDKTLGGDNKHAFSGSLSDSVLDVNSDTLTFTAKTQPSFGQLTFNADGTFIFRPFPHFTGTDSFTYTVSDGKGGLDTATVNLTIVPGATPRGGLPCANMAIYFVPASMSGGFSAGSYDINGNTGTLSITNNSAAGIAPQGNNSYIPAAITQNGIPGMFKMLRW